MTPTRFAGRGVLVTGAGSGIGRAAARLFANEGARVVAADLTDGVQETAAGHDAILPVQGDAGVEDDVARFVAALADHAGRVDVVFANAGVSGGSLGLLDQDAAAFAELLRTNLVGPYLAIKHAVPRMTAGGAIVCTASVAGLRAGAGGLAYSASKAGVINMVQTAAQQLTGTGIRVNAVCPGLIETGMTRDIYDRAKAAGRAEMLGAWTPAKRGGEPEEIAAAVAFLASDEASYVNGHALVVDGGMTSSHTFPRPRTPLAPIL